MQLGRQPKGTNEEFRFEKLRFPTVSSFYDTLIFQFSFVIFHIFSLVDFTSSSAFVHIISVSDDENIDFTVVSWKAFYEHSLIIFLHNFQFCFKLLYFLIYFNSMFFSHCLLASFSKSVIAFSFFWGFPSYIADSSISVHLFQVSRPLQFTNFNVMKLNTYCFSSASFPIVLFHFFPGPRLLFCSSEVFYVTSLSLSPSFSNIATIAIFSFY